MASRLNQQSTLDAVLPRLVDGFSELQQEFDARFQRDAQAWQAAVDEAGLSGTARDLAAELFPPSLRMTEMQIEVSVDIGASDGQRSEVGLAIMAQPVHTFYAARTGLEQSSTSRLTLDVRQTAKEPDTSEERTDSNA